MSADTEVTCRFSKLSHKDEIKAKELRQAIMGDVHRRTAEQVELIADWLRAHNNMDGVSGSIVLNMAKASSGVLLLLHTSCFRAGEQAHFAYYVIKGSIALIDGGQSKKSEALRIHSDEWVGTDEVIAGVNHPFTATATDNATILLKIPRLLYTQSMEEHVKVFNDKVEFISKMALMKHLSLPLVRKLAPCCQTMDFNTKDVMVWQGDNADSMFIIKEGTCLTVVDPTFKVNVSPEGARGSIDKDKTVLVCKLGKGDVVGDMILLSVNQRRSASCIADTSMKVYKVSRYQLLRCLPKDQVQLLRGIAAAKASMTNSKVDSSHSLSSLLMAGKVLQGHNLKLVEEDGEAREVLMTKTAPVENYLQLVNASSLRQFAAKSYLSPAPIKSSAPRMLALSPPASIKDKSPPILSRLMLPTGIFPAASLLDDPNATGSAPFEPPLIEDRGRTPKHWYPSSELLNRNKYAFKTLKAGQQQHQHGRVGQDVVEPHGKDKHSLELPNQESSLQDADKTDVNDDCEVGNTGLDAPKESRWESSQHNHKSELHPDPDTPLSPFSFSIPDIPVMPSRSFGGAPCPECLVSESLPPLWLPLSISREAGSSLATPSRTVRLQTVKPGPPPSFRRSNAGMTSLLLHADLTDSSSNKMYRTPEPQQASSSPYQVMAHASDSGASHNAKIYQHEASGTFSNQSPGQRPSSTQSVIMAGDVGMKTMSWRQPTSSFLSQGSPYYASLTGRAGQKGITVTTAVHWGSASYPNITVSHEELSGIRSRPSTSSTVATPRDDHSGRPSTSSAVTTPLLDRRSRTTSTVSSPFFALVPSHPHRPHHSVQKSYHDFSAFRSKSFKAPPSIREIANVDD